MSRAHYEALLAVERAQAHLAEAVKTVGEVYDVIPDPTLEQDFRQNFGHLVHETARLTARLNELTPGETTPGETPVDTAIRLLNEYADVKEGKVEIKLAPGTHTFKFISTKRDEA